MYAGILFISWLDLLNYGSGFILWKGNSIKWVVKMYKNIVMTTCVFTRSVSIDPVLWSSHLMWGLFLKFLDSFPANFIINASKLSKSEKNYFPEAEQPGDGWQVKVRVALPRPLQAFSELDFCFAKGFEESNSLQRTVWSIFCYICYPIFLFHPKQHEWNAE